MIHEWQKLAYTNRQQALNNKQKHYNGYSCKNCQLTLRFVSNSSCVNCTTIKTKSRSSDVYKKYAQSSKGKIRIKRFRKFDSYKRTQKKWLNKTGYAAIREAKRRSKIALTQEEKLKVKQIYLQRNRLTTLTKVEHHVDHIIPIWMGGTSLPENLQILTVEDHRIKSALEMKLFNKLRQENRHDK